MASGSRSHDQGSAGGAGDDALATLTNPDLANQPAVDLVVLLHRDDRRASDFADVALVLSVRENRHAEAQDRLREAEEVAAGLRERIRALELRERRLSEAERDRTRALELGERRLTEAEAQVRAADEVAASLRDTIRVLADAVARDRTVADEDDESRAADDLTASNIGAAEPELSGGEIRARDLAIVVHELGAGEITPGVCFEAGVEGATPADGEVGENMLSRSPGPLMRIDPVPVTGAPALPDVIAAPSSHEVAPAGVVGYREEVSEAIAGKKRKEPAADLFLPLDELRVTAGSKVSEQEAHGEDVAASPHRLQQVEKPARATKKARRHKWTPIHFHTLVLKALMVKQELMRNKGKEAAIANKEAAAAASKQLHCRCWWSNAPYFPSKSVAVEHDSDDDESSQH